MASSPFWWVADPDTRADLRYDLVRELKALEELENPSEGRQTLVSPFFLLQKVYDIFAEIVQKCHRTKYRSRSRTTAYNLKPLFPNPLSGITPIVGYPCAASQYIYTYPIHNH